MNVYIEKEVDTDFAFDENAVIKKVAESAFASEGAPVDNACVNVLITDNEGIRELNRDYRNIDSPTDVLSFPNLDFDEPDTETFTALPLAVKVGRAGGILPTVYNAANEEAVAAFLAGKTGFLNISEMIAEAVEACENTEDPDVDRILEAEKYARELVRSKIT